MLIILADHGLTSSAQSLAGFRLLQSCIEWGQPSLTITTGENNAKKPSQNLTWQNSQTSGELWILMAMAIISTKRTSSSQTDQRILGSGSLSWRIDLKSTRSLRWASAQVAVTAPTSILRKRVIQKAWSRPGSKFTIGWLQFLAIDLYLNVLNNFKWRILCKAPESK